MSDKVSFGGSLSAFRAIKRNEWTAVRHSMPPSEDIKMFDMLLRPRITIVTDIILCSHCEATVLHPKQLKSSQKGAEGSAEVPVVGRCLASRTLYVLCHIHSDAVIMCPNPNGTVSKVIVPAAHYFRRKHHQDCCNMATPYPSTHSYRRLKIHPSNNPQMIPCSFFS